ncbi:MAG: glutamate mutase L [Chloroflexota bacterium]|nr:glutamate mutase L [Chloroflexota bacterium]
MTSQVLSSASLLAIDIGTISTRAFLFDVVNDNYRFIASGIAPTTNAPPFNDIRAGVTRALQRLQDVTGRTLVGTNGSLITPSRQDGSGVDTVAATLSAGPEIKIVAVGLLDNVSLESARNLAKTTYASVVETISLNDRRKQDARIDAILGTHADMIIVAGGIDDGASQSVHKLLEAVGLACYLISKEQRPTVLFAGNNSIREEVEEALAHITDLHISPNIRPAIHIERLSPAQPSMVEVFKHVRAQQLFGVSDLNQWAGGRLIPSALGLGRVIQFLSKIYAPQKNVLGIDVGASSTTIASANQGDLTLRVFPQLGLGAKLGEILHYIPLEKITPWLFTETPKETTRDYIYNKAVYPASIPTTEEDMAIEQAITRQIIRTAVHQVTSTPSFDDKRPASGLLPWCEPILVTGSVLTNAPTPGQSLLMLLDGLQPTGITTLVLDQNNIINSLGAAAEANPLLTVQLLESNAFLNLATVIAPVGRTRIGAPILRINATLSDGKESSVEVKYGTIEVIPVPLGQSAKLHLRPLHRFDVGMGGPGKSGRVHVSGGVLGIVIDARGRPLQLATDPGRRREMFKRWLWTLGN